ncbi:putative ATP-dependent RNA helicase DHX36-like [Hibiscus syriacus]|uniref:Acyl-[acyl-carrier-protein] hydrolase n=1 Tax=Hibiscus syriacus TaxID=106335 RepID=A0A6A2X0V5_HIBSY|nr:palmitoyl-acyl carrier protein thioesterase, chloroplastic-like [Hibiscus syriacus]KAE8668222.1 putative ATP-dependent RNA helicase DHX36-like [Hibiscus syriacus]
MAAAAFSCSVSFPFRYSRNGNRYHGRVDIKINASSSTRLHPLNEITGAREGSSPLATTTENLHVTEEQIRQRIPTKKQLVDPYRQCLIIERGVGYRQMVVVRSYEVGPYKTVTLESLLNLFQETALSHVWMSGLLSNGFGATHGMMRNSLIWVVSRMHVQVDHYPIWGEVLEFDTLVGASGKNGMRRDWLVRSQATGITYARATSNWVMMNEKMRRLSKMPDEVRDEISPWFIEKQAITEDVPEKIVKLDDSAKYINSDLKPRRSDLDMNHHVNNVKYVRWMLETIPDKFLDSHQLSGMVLEYRRECGSSDRVESLCQPDEDEILTNGVEQSLLKNMVLTSGIVEGNGYLGPLETTMHGYTHLLQTKGKTRKEEIVRGRTRWRKKYSLTST